MAVSASRAISAVAELLVLLLTTVVQFGVVEGAEVRRSCSRKPGTVDCRLEMNQHAAARGRTQRNWDFCAAVANTS